MKSPSDEMKQGTNDEVRPSFELGLQNEIRPHGCSACPIYKNHDSLRVLTTS